MVLQTRNKFSADSVSKYPTISSKTSSLRSKRVVLLRFTSEDLPTHFLVLLTSWKFSHRLFLFSITRGPLRVGPGSRAAWVGYQEYRAYSYLWLTKLFVFLINGPKQNAMTPVCFWYNFLRSFSCTAVITLDWLPMVAFSITFYISLKKPLK